MFFSCIISYNATNNNQKHKTDYAPGLAFLSYVAAGIMFIGIQNSNFNGEGMSKSVRRLFVSTPIPVNEKETQQ